MDIPAGYQLHINSWENDADARKTEILSGLIEADVRFYLDIASQFRSRNGKPKGLGNGSVNLETLVKIFQTALKAHPKISESLQKKYTVKIEGDDEDEVGGERACELICELLGSPVFAGFLNQRKSFSARLR